MMSHRVTGLNKNTRNIHSKRSKIEANHVEFHFLDREHRHYLNVPEPTQAPEPYKIATASSSMARAHRRSSFVILAENETVTSKSNRESPVQERIMHRPKSPNRIMHGRSSPFRPRGFKGPLPHAQYLPPPGPSPLQSSRRFVQIKSLSQGNSPRKQSLIPQPRGRFITERLKETKTHHQNNSERYLGRHAVGMSRSNSLKVLFAKNAVQSTALGTNNLVKQPTKSTIVKIDKTKKAITDYEKKNRSTTKIPIRHMQNGRLTHMLNVDKENEEAEIFSKLPINLRPLPSIPANDASSVRIMNPITAETTDDRKSSDLFENDSGLVDLLKHSPIGSRTSNVVNATTITATQPLNIDTTIIPAEKIDIQNLKKSEITLKNNTVQKQINPHSNQQNEKSHISQNGNISEFVDSVQPILEPMNIEAVIETVARRDVEDIKNDEDRDGKIMQEKIEHTKFEINELNTDATTIHTLEEKNKINETNFSISDSTEKLEEKRRNYGSKVSLKSTNGMSMDSVESVKSNDTGVSLNTVRGVSSASERRGMQIVTRTPGIETLSGNITNLENELNGEPAIIEVVEPLTSEVDQSVKKNQSKSIRDQFRSWKNSFVQQFHDRWASSKSNRNMKLFNWQKKAQKNTSKVQSLQQPSLPSSLLNVEQSSSSIPNYSRYKMACCRSFREKAKISPMETISCCRVERSCGFLCKSTRDRCRWLSCCSCQRELQKKNSIRAKHSLTSVAPPPVPEGQKSKIPDVLVEHNSVMRGAIPCLPVPLAWFCFIWNIFIPGSGTIWSGLFSLCIGQPRFSATTSAKSKFGALLVNTIVGVSQFFTVLFCLVGWGWSIWWGVMMIRLARKWRRFKAAETTNSDPETSGNEENSAGSRVSTQIFRGTNRTH